MLLILLGLLPLERMVYGIKISLCLPRNKLLFSGFGKTCIRIIVLQVIRWIQLEMKLLDLVLGKVLQVVCREIHRMFKININKYKKIS